MFTLDNFYQSKEWVSFVNKLKVSRVNEEGFIICGHCNKAIVSKYDCIGDIVPCLNLNIILFLLH